MRKYLELLIDMKRIADGIEMAALSPKVLMTLKIGV